MANILTRSVCVVAAVLIVADAALVQERRDVAEFRTYGQPARRDADAIDTLIREYRQSWAEQDTAGLMALHAEDVEWINAYARMFRGAAPLSDFLANRLFPAFDPSVSREEAANMKTVSVRHLGDHAAVVHLYTDGPRGSSRNSDEELRRTHIHLVLEKQEGVWKIVHTAIMDAR